MVALDLRNVIPMTEGGQLVELTPSPSILLKAGLLHNGAICLGVQPFLFSARGPPPPACSTMELESHRFGFAFGIARCLDTNIDESLLGLLFVVG